MTKIMIAVAVLTILMACSEKSWNENPDQQRFYKTFTTEKSTDAQIDQLRLAKSNPIKDWNVWVDNVSDNGPYTIISARYGSMSYRLFIFGDEARAKARGLGKNSHLIISGDLGPERSATRFGATSNPEFEFYPSAVINGTTSIHQDDASIAALMQEAQRRYEKDRLLQEKKDRDEAVEAQVVDVCKQAVLSTLHYPASGSFSWFQKEVKKESNAKWIYRDVITAKNVAGAELPVRFSCAVTIKNDKLTARVKLLD